MACKEDKIFNKPQSIKWISKKDAERIFPGIEAKEGTVYKISNRNEKIGIFHEPVTVIDTIRLMRDMNKVKYG